jgi:hypothetical protein
MVIIWAIGYFAYNAGSLIHIFLFIGILAIVLRNIHAKRIS